MSKSKNVPGAKKVIEFIKSFDGDSDATAKAFKDSFGFDLDEALFEFAQKKSF